MKLFVMDTGKVGLGSTDVVSTVVTSTEVTLVSIGGIVGALEADVFLSPLPLHALLVLRQGDPRASD